MFKFQDKYGKELVFNIYGEFDWDWHFIQTGFMDESNEMSACHL